MWKLCMYRESVCDSGQQSANPCVGLVTLVDVPTCSINLDQSCKIVCIMADKTIGTEMQHNGRWYMSPADHTFMHIPYAY